MAEVKTIKIDVDTKQATKAMDDLAKATHDVSASFEEVYGELQPLTTRMGEAEDRLYELANAGQTTTKEYQDLLKTVGNYRKVQIQTDLAVDAAATTMGQKLGGAIGGTTSAFAVAQGTVGLFGGELQELEKILLRVQAALAIQQGVQGVREAIPSFRELKNVAVAAFEGMTTAGKAFALTGIGLVITALALIAQNWDKIAGSTNEAEKRQKAYQDALKKQSEFIGRESKEFATLISRLKSTNQGTKERENLIQKINTQYGTTLKNLKDEAAFQNQANNELKAYLEFQKAKYKLQANEELIARNLEKQSKLRSQIAKAQSDEQKARDEMEKSGGSNAIMIRRIQYQVELQAELNTELKAAEKRFEAYGSAAQNASAAVEKLTQNGTKYLTVATPKEKKEDVKKEIEEIETLKTNSLESGVAALQKTRNEELLIEKQASDDRLAIKQQELEALQIIADAENKIRDANISNIEAGIGLVKNLFQDNKKIQSAALIAESAVSIARTIISTKAANQAARAQGTAASIITGGASVLAAEALVLRNNIGAGISVAAQIAATAKGISALGGGGTPPSSDNSSDGGGGGSFSPNFNVVGNSNVNQLAQLQQQPVQAYVVSGSVTTAQSLDRNRIENATL